MDNRIPTLVASALIAFASALGPLGRYLVSIGIVLFAFSTIIGWEYYGEKAFEYLVHDQRLCIIYRVVFSLVVYIGATQALDVVWNFSDIMNALMAIPNLISLLVLSGAIKEEVDRYQPVIDAAKKRK